MSPIDPVEFGQVKGRLDAVDDRCERIERTVDSMNDKLDTVLQALAERRGERTATKTIAAMTATVISILIAVMGRYFDR